jgi:hypothetical protein
MSELDDFLATTLARQIEAEQALLNGDAGPRSAMTPVQDPVTVFGAKVPLRRGWDEVSEILRWLASRWSKCTDYRFDLVAAGASGDIAYLIGFEHIANSVAGVAVEPYTCASPTSSAASRASGRSHTARPTTSRWIRPIKARHRRSRRIRAIPAACAEQGYGFAVAGARTLDKEHPGDRVLQPPESRRRGWSGWDDLATGKAKPGPHFRPNRNTWRRSSRPTRVVTANARAGRAEAMECHPAARVNARNTRTPLTFWKCHSVTQTRTSPPPSQFGKLNSCLSR